MAVARAQLVVPEHNSALTSACFTSCTIVSCLFGWYVGNKREDVRDLPKGVQRIALMC